MAKNKRDLVVISDVHLGTYGCNAKELLKYLKSVSPNTLVLNGDIIDIWQFKKRYWPKSHMKVIKYIIGLAAKGVKVYYITGNHDEMLRKFNGLKVGNLEIVNKLELELDGKKAWFFHGDVFDVIMQHSKWLAKLGAIGYDTLIYINTFVNWISKNFGKGKVSLSKKVKDNVKSAVKFIDDFELTAAKTAINKGFDYVVCGHIHEPQKRKIEVGNQSVEYLNSGDWIENLSALEYHKKKWSVVKFEELFTEDQSSEQAEEMEISLEDKNQKEIFKLMLEEFQN